MFDAYQAFLPISQSIATAGRLQRVGEGVVGSGWESVDSVNI